MNFTTMPMLSARCCWAVALHGSFLLQLFALLIRHYDFLTILPETAEPTIPPAHCAVHSAPGLSAPRKAEPMFCASASAAVTEHVNIATQTGTPCIGASRGRSRAIEIVPSVRTTTLAAKGIGSIIRHHIDRWSSIAL